MQNTTLITLTPEFAETLLTSNTSNRQVRDSYVTTLSNAIQRGEWMINGDSIRVSKDGILLDGQHRCMAVVKSGISIQTFITYGLEPDVFSTIDRGITRTTADALHIKGISYARETASLTRMAVVYKKTGNPHSTNREFTPTTQEQMDYLQENPSIYDAVLFISKLAWIKKYATASIAMFCFYVFSQQHKAACINFMYDLESGADLEETSPILLLRNRLIDARSEKKTKINNFYKTALMFKAFRLYISNTPVKTLRVRTEGDTAEKDLFTI